MSIEKNIQIVKDFFAAIGRGDKEALLALVAEDLVWIIPGEDWLLAVTKKRGNLVLRPRFSSRASMRS